MIKGFKTNTNNTVVTTLLIAYMSFTFSTLTHINPCYIAVLYVSNKYHCFKKSIVLKKASSYSVTDRSTFYILDIKVLHTRHIYLI